MTGIGTARIQVRLYHGDAIALGPGKAELLASIAETGSISAAARRMGRSYRRAWLLVDTMNRCFVAPLVTSTKGGSHGGGAQLTALGAQLLAEYRALEQALADTAAPHLERLRAKLAIEAASR